MKVRFYASFPGVIIIIVVLFLYLQDVMRFQFLTYRYSEYYQLYVLLYFLLVLFGTIQYKREKIIYHTIKYIGSFGILVTAITFLYGFWRDDQSLSLYLSVPSCFMSYFTFLYISRNVSSPKLMFVLDIFVCGLIIVYFIDYNNIYLVSLARNNAVYIVLLTLPLVMLNRNRVVSIILSIIILVALISSAKRTGTIATFLGIISYLFLALKNVDKHPIYNITIFLSVGLFAFYLYGSFIDSLLFERLSTMEETEGSTRYEVMQTSISLIADSNFYQYILGHGWNQVFEDSKLKLSAHNDFIEVFYDFGIIGFMFFVAICVQIVKICRMLLFRKNYYSGSIVCFIVVFLFLTMFSHIIIYTHLCIIMFAYLGIFSGIINRNENYRNFDISLG